MLTDDTKLYSGAAFESVSLFLSKTEICESWKDRQKGAVRVHASGNAH
jgi:hypothetical protein